METRFRFAARLILLMIVALLLITRLIYLYVADPHRFPLNTYKVVASYEHLSRKLIEEMLSDYSSSSFFSIPIKKLRDDIQQCEWVDNVSIERLWPDTLKIKVTEKKPVAVWNKSLITANGDMFAKGGDFKDIGLPRLSGPEDQLTEVLQIHQKLSKLVNECGLYINKLMLSENEAWDLILNNNVKVRLGKKDIEKRLRRFCKAYPIAFADKSERLGVVDLRYARGMAVDWK